ncbi:MAG: long-chain fatty acid--CoA ligase, partial [Deltaproteobacteria bacterium]|nr:long-chain fatty acid--CoA ligase [Deltaproteobacteria bacterium]
PTVLMARFDAAAALEAMERHRVSVLAAVSTQFIMLLNSPAMERCDLGALRVLFTGGEAVPYERAAEFEERSGAKVLQFYGSNETGAVSATRLDDSQARRLGSAGRVIPEMNVRLFDEDGRDVTATGRTLSRGYWGDEPANAELVREDGWMLLGDIVHLDSEGYLSVMGRSDDFIIRGGKNVSARAVEEQVASHPAVALAAAVAMPDPVFGERVCCYVELREGEASLGLDALLEHLAASQVSKEYYPERLVILDSLPRGSGGKIAKGQLREDIRRRVAEELREDEADAETDAETDA